jgi:hypothetical protein
MCCFPLIPVLFIGAIVVWVRFVESLTQALNRCEPRFRAMNPDHVRFLHIPVLNGYWWFRTVGAVAQSLRREFADRGIDRGGSYGITVGVATGAIGAVSVVSLGALIFLDQVPKIQGIVGSIGLVLGIVAVTLWAVYWTIISNYLTRLRNDDERRDDYDEFDEDYEPPPRRDGPERVEDRYR